MSISYFGERITQEKKKLIISGFTGVLIASLIIASIFASFWVGPGKSASPSFPSGLIIWASDIVKLFVSNFTEPVGVGSEGVLTVFMTSPYDVSNVTLRLELIQDLGASDWPIGIDFVASDSASWNGDLRANISSSFNVKIKAVEVGYAHVWASMTGRYEQMSVQAWSSLWIHTSQDDIQASQDPITPPGVIVARNGDGTLPLWPNGTSPLGPIKP